MDLAKISINIIKEYQHQNGAYPACPHFDTYKYCWLRDGSFIAHAMDRVGEHDSSTAFFGWVHTTIQTHRASIERLIAQYDNGDFIDSKRFPPARYQLDGTLEEGEWPNFQLDGYGTWLWAISEHVSLTKDEAMLHQCMDSIMLTIRYLVRFWDHENYDCWEENGDKVHTSTLGCIYGGLKAVNQYIKDANLSNTADAIRLFIVRNCTYNGRLIKYIGSDQVDASLLWLCIPFEVFAPSSTVMSKTVKKIEQDLWHDGGVHRYHEDTYYGGGEWLLLSSWLGWYYLVRGDIEAAQNQHQWVQNQADNTGCMTEQSLSHVNDPTKIQKWVTLWGEVANPLLWSHAMYLILDSHLLNCDYPLK